MDHASGAQSPGEAPTSGDRPISLRVEYTRLNSFFADYTRNISKGSTFVKTDRPPSVGTRFLFAFQLPDVVVDIPETATRRTYPPDDARVLPLVGVVRWVTNPSQAAEDKPPGMGVEFLFGDANERDAIHAWVCVLMRSALGDQLTERLLASSLAK